MSAPRDAARDEARALAHAALARGEPLAWFEELYARAAGDASRVPWADLAPSEQLLAWLAQRTPTPTGRALVVGCGLGDDAEELARRGLQVTAFDVSATAVAWCRRRFPSSRVEYVQADLFALPAAFSQRFDFVLESNTLQALPAERRPTALAALAEVLAPGGTLLVLARGRRADEPSSGPPWPLLREELRPLAVAGLVETAFEEWHDAPSGPNAPTVRRFRAEYLAPAPGPNGVRRFDDRVENYDRYRPDYPDEIVGLLRGGGLPVAGHVADVGAGTGKLGAVFLRAGYRVTAVEPGDAMRAAAERRHAAEPGYRSVKGTAEDSGLPAGSVDAIVAGQAFHWFEPRATRREFLRVLAPGAGFVALIWNERDEQASPLLADYEALLRQHSPSYLQTLRHEPTPASLAAFFAPAPMTVLRCPSRQVVDLDGLLGRVLSASYVPLAGPAHDAILDGVRASFERNARDGRVTLPYETRMFTGRLREPGPVG